MNNQFTPRANKSLIKEINTMHILREVRQNMPISRAEISRMTGLTPATVSSNLIPLLERGIVRETGEGHSSGGRKPTLLELNPQALYSVGLDVGPTRIKAALIDLAGNMRMDSLQDRPLALGSDQIMMNITEVLNDLLYSYALDSRQLLGIGIGMHGLVDPKAGISLYAPAFDQWNNVPLKNMLESTYRLPVYVDNDVRAMALGEKWFGTAKQMDHFLYINVGTSIGSAIYSHNRMLEGAMSSAGEIGHIFSKDNAIRCFCGKIGCLSTVAAGPALEREALRQLQEGASSVLERYVSMEGGMKGEWIHQAAKQGDALANHILDQAAEEMGKVLAAAVNLFNPEQIVLGGGVAKAGDILIPKIKETIELYAMKHHTEHMRIVETALGDRGGIIGSATLVLDAFFNQPSDFLARSEGE